MFTITNDKKAFAGLFDTSMLRATNVEREYIKLCEEAVDFGFACVAVNGCFIKLCADIIKGSGVKLTCATSFPLGLCSLDIKLKEMENAFENGATDVDVILNISKILDHNWVYLEKEMDTIARYCREAGKTSKLIFETCYLNYKEISEMCRIANNTRPDFIKTCTGTAGPATDEVVALMRQESHCSIKVKASGGVHNLDRVEAVLKAGADRIGTISAAEIMQQYAKKYL